MLIENFTTDHVAEAMDIAKQNYEEERKHVPALPPIDAIPDLTPYANNSLGVAAFDGSTMVGFLCCVPPFKNAFSSTDATGVFSPMGANGAIGNHRADVYARMYQAAGENWVQAGASSHAICTYAHDAAAQEQLFRYGFGMRCIDAIRGMDEIAVPPCPEYEFCELHPDEFTRILPLDHMLDAHMAASPAFILRSSKSETSFVEMALRDGRRYFTAKSDGEIVAFVGVARDGETFICESPEYIHIATGAYCLPEHRGKGVFQNLLNSVIYKLYDEEFTRFGVDFESINPKVGFAHNPNAVPEFRSQESEFRMLYE